MKRILTAVLCLAMVLSLFAGCGEDTPDPTQTTAHKHSYSKTWSADESGHWYAADCGHALKANQGEHLDENVDGICDICAWADPSCQHTFDETTWLTDESSHWYGATCDHYGAVKDKAEHTDEDNDGACDVCGYTGDHTHSFSEEWSSDDKQHWHDASCGHSVKNDTENHADYNADGTCDVCGWFDQSHSHSFGDEWAMNVVYHWHPATCEHTGAMADQAEHADADGDKHCDVCNFEMCDHMDYDDDGTCDLCGWADPKHSHEYGEMASDKNEHWYVATCHPGATSQKEAHVDGNQDGTCDSCQFQICGHSFAAEWSSDDTHHWHDILCTCFIPRKDYEPHTLDEDGVCTECMYGYIVESGYEVVADNVPFTIVMDYMITWAEFKVNFPQPGRYVITLINPNGDQDIRVSQNNSGEVDRQTDGFTLEVAEAGEMTLYFRVFDMGFYAGKELPITYSVVRSDDMVIDTLKGKVELPANTLYKLKFTAPEVGEYKLITSVEGLVIGMQENEMEFFKGHISFTVTEVGEEFTFYIQLDDVERKSFIFDWILEPPFSMNVDAEGNYPVAVSPNQIDYKIEFTAPEAGYYSLSVDSKWLTFCYWSEIYNQPVRGDGDVMEKQEVLTGWLEAGEVYTTWLQTVYDYPDSVDCRDTLTVSNIGEMVEIGNLTMTPGTEGSKYTFTATETVYYHLAATDGQIGVIGTNGKITWVSSYEVKVAAGYSYSFMVAGDGEVKVDITTRIYSATLDEGENVLTLAPAKEYDVSFGNYFLRDENGQPYPLVDEEGNPLVDENGNIVYATTVIDPNRKVKLSWTDGRLIVYVDGVQVQPGVEVELLHSTVMIRVLSNVETEVKLTVEVTNAEVPELTGDTAAVLQENLEAKLLISDGQSPATASFTAGYGGTFVLTCNAEVQLNVYIRNADGSYSFAFETKATESGTTGTYEFQLEAGQTITFEVRTPGSTAVNAFVTVRAK